MIKKVIVDVDAGCDDAVAILLLLTLEQSKNFQVVGITCTHGNTTLDNVCRNVLTTLESINRLDIPVFRGAEGPLIPWKDPSVHLKDFHGKNGFGDVNIPNPKGQIQNENAVSALNRMAEENEGITLICLGPLTNIALATRTYSTFVKRVSEIYIMGGNVKGMGNSSPVAEFNFYIDPEAAVIVLNSLSCPITIFPWESCLNRGITLEERFNKIGVIPRAHIRLLNKVEASIFSGAEFWIPCDAFLAGCFLEDKMITQSRNINLTVELQGLYTRGQGIVDHLQKKNPNVKVVDEIDIDIFKELIFKMASYSPKVSS